MKSRTVKPSLGLGLAIGAWALSPLLIYESRGLAEPPILALYAVTLGSALAWATFLASGRVRLRDLGRSPGARTRQIEAGLVGLAAFVAYPLLYFSAIQKGPPAAVNLVNYLWPVVAVVVVAAGRSGGRYLETGLAAGFGFAGAGLAIAAGVGVDTGVADPGILPFALAGLGALTYGATSGAISIRHPIDRKDSFSVFTLALLFGGIVTALILLVLVIVRPDLVALDVSDHRPWALLAYAVLLPVAHLSWMTAVRDPKVPAFAAAYLVPVISTGILTLVVTGVAKPEVLSALVLVLCGIAFASMREKGVPVGYAVTLSFLASVQVSQVLAGRIGGTVNSELDTISQLLAAIVAVFAGFVLSNAIGRYSALQRACGACYARAATMLTVEPPAAVERELDRIDALAIYGEDADFDRSSKASRSGIARERAEVELAVSNNVSAYEWLVLLIGAGGLLIVVHAYAVDSTSAFTILLRAITVSLVVGILFAIRDYDHHRPRRLCSLLTVFRRTYGIPISGGSPLAVGVEYWMDTAPYKVRAGLIALIVVATVAISLNI